MTVTLKAVGKWISVLGAVAAAVIGSVGVATMPTSLRVVLVAVGAAVVAVERVLTTTITISSPTNSPKGP